jgi:ribosomal protein S18 acetylase RimI-like enzyme
MAMAEPSSPRPAVRYVVLTWVPEPALAEWDEWHNEVHIPHVLAAPQMRGVAKFRVRETTLPADFAPQYATLYALDSLEDFEAYRSGPGVALRREYDERYGASGRVARLLLTEAPPYVIRAAASPGDFEEARALLREYARSLHFDLSFQGFDREVEGLPGEYAEPAGTILLAREAGSGPGKPAAGCVGLRPIGDGRCEMKRLYVRPEHRGRALGKRLAERIVREGERRGYRAMRLDTVPSMDEAIALYRALGFRTIEPYRANPIPGALFFEKALRG